VKIEQIEWPQWLSQVYKDANYDLTIIATPSLGYRQLRQSELLLSLDNKDFQALYKESEQTVETRSAASSTRGSRR